MSFNVTVKPPRAKATPRQHLIGWIVTLALVGVSWLAVALGAIPGP